MPAMPFTCALQLMLCELWVLVMVYVVVFSVFVDHVEMLVAPLHE